MGEKRRPLDRFAREDGGQHAKFRVAFVGVPHGLSSRVRAALPSDEFEVDELARGSPVLDPMAGGPDVVVLGGESTTHAVEECARVQAEGNVLVVALLRSRRAGDRARVLEAGADDAFSCPVAVEEVGAGIRALLRRRMLDRQSLSGATVRRVGPLEIDLDRLRSRYAGRELRLTTTEFRLLALLAREPGRAFTRREILSALWGSSHVGSGRVCDIYVSNLRRKLEPDPRHPRHLVTVRGVGYALVGD